MADDKIDKEQRKNKLRRSRNRKYKTLIKNHLKSLQINLKKKDVNFSELQNLLSGTQKILDRAARKKIIHRNKAVRYKSQLSKKINLRINASSSVTE